jgi:hypothetical protein
LIQLPPNFAADSSPTLGDYPTMRFTLPKLFLAVAIVAIACAGTLNHTSGWAIGIFTLTCLLFAVAVIRAIGSRGKKQAFSIAIVVVGFSYLLVAVYSGSAVRLSLPTNYALALAARQLQIPAVPRPTYTFTSSSGSSSGGSGSSTANGTTSGAEPQLMPLDAVIIAASTEREATAPLGRFFLIGHCVCAWLLALLAGLFAVLSCDIGREKKT